MTKKNKKAIVIKKKVWTKLDEYYVKEVKNIFDLFTTKLNENVPVEIIEELEDLMMDYASEENMSPVKAIKKALNEWLEGGRI
jgi:hypothetical protein